ncbi:MAG: 3'-5' exonuclease [Betaproteobacteria bacterium RIFCSPLOWO2_12_FULL_62_58]|nr:MAG: 3'-5' exonuclease [Betaproteobacteria bacterium RIFCSPLOWO2_12_FULL_62_58]
MTPVLAFDIETVPDIAGLRKLHGLGKDVTDRDVADMAFQLRRQATGGDFLPLHLHRVIVISCALRERDSFRVWSLGDTEDDEGGLIQRFFDGVEKYTPQIVSWNGGGFDFPVLHYRGLIHGVKAPRYWDMGEGDYRDSRDFKWNNYISRYHARHLDLMDLLALYQPRANAPLDDLAQLVGLPGKLGLEGAGVWPAYQAGKLADIRNYCEIDVANTYLLFLRFQLMRGALTGEQHAAECDLVRSILAKAAEPHWKEFLQRWRT